MGKGLPEMVLRPFVTDHQYQGPLVPLSIRASEVGSVDRLNKATAPASMATPTPVDGCPVMGPSSQKKKSQYLEFN